MQPESVDEKLVADAGDIAWLDAVYGGVDVPVAGKFPVQTVFFCAVRQFLHDRERIQKCLIDYEIGKLSLQERIFFRRENIVDGRKERIVTAQFLQIDGMAHG